MLVKRMHFVMHWNISLPDWAFVFLTVEQTVNRIVAEFKTARANLQGLISGLSCRRLNCCFRASWSDDLPGLRYYIVHEGGRFQNIYIYIEVQSSGRGLGEISLDECCKSNSCNWSSKHAKARSLAGAPNRPICTCKAFQGVTKNLAPLISSGQLPWVFHFCNDEKPGSRPSLRKHRSASPGSRWLRICCLHVKKRQHGSSYSANVSINSSKNVSATNGDRLQRSFFLSISYQIFPPEGASRVASTSMVTSQHLLTRN